MKKIVSISLIVTIIVSIFSIHSISVNGYSPYKYGVSLVTPKKITLGLGENYEVESRCSDKGYHSNFYDVVPEGYNSVIAGMKINGRTSYCLIKSKTIGEGDYYWTYSSKYYKKPKYKYGEPCDSKYATEFRIDVKEAPKKVYLNRTNIRLKRGQYFILSEKTNAGSYANPEHIRWSSSNKNITIVERINGTNKATIKALRKGTCYITVRVYNGKTAKCKITVK